MKRWSLRLLVASISVSALLGIWALVVGRFDEFHARVLWTSVCVSGASVFIGACSLAWDRHRSDIVPLLGILASCLGFGILGLAPWVDITCARVYEVAVAAIIAGFFLAHISLLSLARLALRYRPVQGLAMLVSLVLGGLLISLIFWNDPPYWPPYWLDRLLGALFIAFLSTTGLVGVLHRLTRELEQDP